MVGLVFLETEQVMPRPPQVVYKPTSEILISVATPGALKRAIYKRYQIDHDPCPLNGHITGPDGLDRSIPWGKRNYLNPPYIKSGIEAFVDRAIEEMALGNASYFLMPFRASLLYFHRAMEHCTGVRFLTRNIRFEGYKHPLPQQLVLMEFEPGRPAKFRRGALGEDEVWEIQ
jgi:hypothetical protein